MKKSISLFVAVASSLLTLLFTACQQELLEPDQTSIVTVRIADVTGQTRTSYDNSQGKFAWNEGDQIAVHYKGGRYESITLSVNSTDAAVASFISSSVGSKLRDFYAVYPASSAVPPADGDTAPKVSLPAEYDLTALASGLVDYSPAILVAENVPDEDLAFFHAGGLLRVMLAAVDPASVKLKVVFASDVTGEYQVAFDDESMPFIETQGTTDNNVVSFKVDASVIGDDGILELNVPLPCGTYDWVQVQSFNDSDEKLNDWMHSTSIEIARHHGKRMAFAENAIELFLGDLPDTEQAPIDIAQPAKLTDQGGIVTISSSFVSYLKDGDQISLVPFHVEYSANGRTGWSQTAPDWLNVSGTVVFDGSSPDFPQEFSLVADPLKNLVEKNAFGVALNDHTRALRAKAPVTMDLSKYNVATGSMMTNSSTANTYVIQGPGTYSIPLVYGNGIKNGEINEPAFHARKKVGDTYVYRTEDEVVQSDAIYLAYMIDHSGNSIHTPYIAEQLSTESGFTAKVLWMDNPGMIESVSYDPGSGSDRTDDCLTVVITQDGICQGNAVIALFDSSDRIVWSWHLWMTDQDFSRTTSLPDGTIMAPVPLGWCDYVLIERYQEQKCYVRIVQDYAGGLVSNAVLIDVGADSRVYRKGNSTFYQAGRKDPFPGSDGESGYFGEKACYPSVVENEYYPRFGVPLTVAYYESIQNPYIHYARTLSDDEEGTDAEATWLSPTYGNLWNTAQTTHTWRTAYYNTVYDPVTKSIYDPSPVGFKVPGAESFKNLKYEDVALYSASSSIAVRTYQIGTALFPAVGQHGTVLSYYNSVRFTYLTANFVRYNSAAQYFAGLYYHVHNSYSRSQLNRATITAFPVLCTVDD